MNAEFALDILKTLFLGIGAAAAVLGNRRLAVLPRLVESFLRLESATERLIKITQSTKVYAEGAEGAAREVRAAQREEVRAARASRPGVGDTGRWQALDGAPSSADAARGLAEHAARDHLPSTP